MGVTNKFKVFADGSGGTTPNTYNDDAYAANTERPAGCQANTVISSQLMNTAHKTASLISVALVDALIELAPSITGTIGLDVSYADVKAKLKSLITTYMATSISGKENSSNKVAAFVNPTNTQYPSAKLVYDTCEKFANRVTVVGSGSDDSHYPTAKAAYNAAVSATHNYNEVLTQFSHTDYNVQFYTSESSCPTMKDGNWFGLIIRSITVGSTISSVHINFGVAHIDGSYNEIARAQGSDGNWYYLFIGYETGYATDEYHLMLRQVGSGQNLRASGYMVKLQ